MKSNAEAKRLYTLMHYATISKVISKACSLRLDEKISDSPLSIAKLSTELGYSPRAMYRFLRVLEAYDIVKLLNEDEVIKGPLCDFLESIRGPHLLHGYKNLENLEISLISNDECYSTTFGKPFYPHILEDGKLVADLKEWGRASALNWLLPAVTSTYDFSFMHNFCEINSDGFFTGYLLKYYLDCKGFIFNKEALIPKAKEVFKEFSIEERVLIYQQNSWILPKELVKKNQIFIFFRALINFSSDQLKALLASLTAQLKSGTKILIIDFMLPDKSHEDYQLGTLVDINILTCLGSGLRTKEEWLAACDHPKFSDIKFLPLKSDEIKLILPAFLMEISIS